MAPKLYDALAAQDLGYVILGDLAGQSFGNGCFAHACSADEDRIVLGPATQYLDHAKDLRIPPNDGV
jgi:hypothetical protein